MKGRRKMKGRRLKTAGWWMAEQPDPGMTVPLAYGTDMRCWRARRRRAEFSCRPLWCCLRSRIVFSSKHLGLYLESPVVAVCGGVFPAVGVNLHRHQVTLDGVLVAEQGSANFPGAVTQFSVENLTRQTVRFHAVHMAQPAETSLHEHRRNAHEAGSLKDVCVRDPVLPSYVQHR